MRGRRTFEDLRRSGRTGRAGPISVTYLALHAPTEPRMAFAIRRQVGTAVARNRLRRRLRAIAGATALPPGAYLVRPSDRAGSLGFAQLTRAFADAVHRATDVAP